MQEFMPCAALKKLDEAHSIMVTLAEQGNTSAVLTTIASVLGSLPSLEKSENDTTYWINVVVNLNTLADTLANQELLNDGLYDEPLSDEDWALAGHLGDEDHIMSDY